MTNKIVPYKGGGKGGGRTVAPLWFGLFFYFSAQRGIGRAKCLATSAAPVLKKSLSARRGGGGGRDSDTFFSDLKKCPQYYHNGVGVLSLST